jgi:hypothetical protein
MGGAAVKTVAGGFTLVFPDYFGNKTSTLQFDSQHSFKYIDTSQRQIQFDLISSTQLSSVQSSSYQQYPPHFFHALYPRSRFLQRFPRILPHPPCQQ